MATMSQLTKEEKNFTKLFLLTFKVSSEITRRYFDTVFPQLAQTLNNKKHVIINLNKAGVINATQLGILRSIPGTIWPSNLPALPSGTKAMSSKDFDLTLMICLLRNFGGLRQPTNGWDQLPHMNDMSPGAHLATFKCYRNQLAHTSDWSMENTEFSNQWTRMEKALTYLNCGQIPQEATDLFNLDLDGEVATSVAEGEIKQLIQNFLDCERELQQIKSEFSHYRDGHLPKNIKDANETLVNTWQMEDDIFYETRGAQHINDKVNNFDCILVTGMSGYGKTAAIRHIALLLKSQNFDILSIETPEDIIKYQIDQNQVFLIDDVVGKHDLSHNLLEKWEIINEKLIVLLNAKKGTKKILCTLRNQVALQERFKYSSTILNKCVLNLNEEPIALSIQEKKNILFRHLEKHGLENKVTKEEADVICKSDYAFPLLCKLVTINVERFQQRDSFFKQPLSFMRVELDNMRTQNKKLYCTLVLCMLYNGALEKGLSGEEAHEKIRNIMNICGLQRDMPMIELSETATSAVGSYFINSFKFIHDALEETVAYHFCRLNPRVMFTECDISFIRDRVRVQSNEIAEENIVILQEKELNQHYLRPIYKRFLDELKIGRFSNVLMSQLLKNKQFVRVFATVLNQNILIGKLLKIESSERLTSMLWYVYREIDQSDVKRKVQEMTLSKTTFQKRYNAIGRVITAIPSRSTLIYWVVAFGCYDFFECVWRQLTCIERKRILDRKYYSFSFAKTFFPLAVLGGNIDIISELIASGADVNCCSEFLETPLYIAAKSGRRDIVMVLVTNGAKVNLQGWFNMKVPIIITSGNPVLTTILLEHDLLQTELHTAILQDDLEKLCSNIGSVDINSTTKSGWTPLHYAVALKNVKVVGMLFNEVKTQKPNVNIRDNNGLTAIHLAVINDDIDTLTVLLRNKAEVKVRDNYDRTPLHYTKSVDVTKKLLADENNINAELEPRNEKEYINKPASALRTVLWNITLHTVFRVFRDFVNMPDKDGNTPLHSHMSAITESDSKTESDNIIQILLQNGADPFLHDDIEHSVIRHVTSRGKRNYDKIRNSKHGQIIKYTYNVLTTILVLGFFLTCTSSTISYYYPSYFDRESGNLSCFSEEVRNFNNNGTISFNKVTTTFPVVLLTVIFFGVLSITNYIKYPPFWKRVEFVLIPVTCSLAIAVSLFLYTSNVYTFIYKVSGLALLCTMLRQLVSDIYCFMAFKIYSFALWRFMFAVEVLIFISITFMVFLIPFKLSFHNIHFLNDIYISNVFFSNCSTLSLVNMSCVVLDSNATFEKDFDFFIQCNTISSTTNYSGTLIINNGISWSDLEQILLFYFSSWVFFICNDFLTSRLLFSFGVRSIGAFIWFQISLSVSVFQHLPFQNMNDTLS